MTAKLEKQQDANIEQFPVDKWPHRIGGFIKRHRQLFIKLGNFESAFLDDRLADVIIKKPIFIAGIARAGTTILLELLAEIPGMVTHQYRDYPFIYTPYWWNHYLNMVPGKKGVVQERAHKDGIFVTSDSPEAMEEILWMSFFENAHNPQANNMLLADVTNSDFEKYYVDHIKKLILIRKGNRYLSKGNYNLSRLAYIQRIMPSARFVVPVRDPSAHVASLMKQHALFCNGMKDNAKALEHLRRIGHFEFGLDLRPINMGDDELIKEIQSLWNSTDAVRGWSKYWAYIYTRVHQQLSRDSLLSEATYILPYEKLCSDSTNVLKAVLLHCGISDDSKVIEKYAPRLNPPNYYKPKFSDKDMAIIEDETGQAASLLGL